VNTVSIIIPTYNEALNLPLLIPQIAAAMRSRGWTWEAIVVDDNSTDGTPAVLADLSARFPQLRCKIRPNERGLSSAVLAGMSMARYDVLVNMDADLSHPPESLPDLVDKLIHTDAEFVIGSRYVPGGKTEDWGLLRSLNSAGATLLAKPLVGPVRDPMAGYFALRRQTLAQADALNPIGYKIALELIVKCHVQRVAEVPITFHHRRHGQSKLTLKEQLRYLEHLSRLYDYKYPKASPRVKFLVAAGAGAAACFAVAGTLNHWVNALLFLPAALLAMVLVTLAFFIRYVVAQRNFIQMRHPFSEFTYISLAELLTGWFFGLSTGDAQTHWAIKTSVAVGVVLVIRYTLRKFFLHDLRGIRGTPRPGASIRVTFAPRPQSNPAAAG